MHSNIQYIVDRGDDPLDRREHRGFECPVVGDRRVLGGLGLQRQRDLIKVGLSRIDRWVCSNAKLVSVVRPKATPLACIRYSAELPSIEIATAIRERASVLVAPGVFMGAEHHLRLSHSLDPQRTVTALERIATVLRSLS